MATEGGNQLLACLTLVAAANMSAEDRQAWIVVARETLTGIPADLLKRGCHAARMRCRFASEIVPAIMDEVAAEWKRRRHELAHQEAAFANRNARCIEKQDPQYITAVEFRKLMQAHFGGDAA